MDGRTPARPVGPGRPALTSRAADAVLAHACTAQRNKGKGGVPAAGAGRLPRRELA